MVLLDARLVLLLFRMAKTGFFVCKLAFALASSLAFCHSLSLSRRSLGFAATLFFDGLKGDAVFFSSTVK